MCVCRALCFRSVCAPHGGVQEWLTFSIISRSGCREFNYKMKCELTGEPGYVAGVLLKHLKLRTKCFQGVLK